MSRVLVFGGGVPALACTIDLLRAGRAVDLVGPTEAARHPCLPQGGLLLGREPERLAEAIASSGASASVATRLARAAGPIVEALMGYGVPFARDGDELALRRLPGWSEAEAVYVGARTASSIAWALDTEIGRLVDRGADLRRLPEREILDLVVDDGGAVCGLVLFDRVAGAIEGWAGEAVVLATTGAAGTPFGETARLFPELALSAAYRAGAAITGRGEPELHPTMLRHGRIPQPLSSALRAEGARAWVPRDVSEARIPRDIPPSDRDYFAEEHFGKDALPDDRRLAALLREVTEARGVYDRDLGDHRGTAYLDISHLPAGHLAPRLGEELDAIARRAPRDPHRGPFEIGAGAVGLGVGLWVDGGAPEREQQTSLPGLWAVGACAWPAHGRPAFDGLSLVAEIHTAQLAAAAILASEDRRRGEDAVQSVEAAQARADAERRDSSGGAAETGDDLADAIDDLGFDLAPAREIRQRLVDRIAPRGEGRPADGSERAVAEALELTVAACLMKERGELRRWRRDDDGMAEEMAP